MMSSLYGVTVWCHAVCSGGGGGRRGKDKLGPDVRHEAGTSVWRRVVDKRSLQAEKDNVPIRVCVVVAASTMGKERMGQDEVADLEIDGERRSQVREDLASCLCLCLWVPTPVSGVAAWKDGKLARVPLSLWRQRKPSQKRKVVWKPKPRGVGLAVQVVYVSRSSIYRPGGEGGGGDRAWRGSPLCDLGVE